jgi:hypothetical protein
VTGQFRRLDVVASADGNARKSRGVVQKVLELTEEEWAARGYCWMTHYDCMRGSQPCLRSRPDGPGDWAIVLWDGYPGPYAEPAGNLVKLS